MNTSKKQTRTGNSKTRERDTEKGATNPKMEGRKIKRKAIVRRGRKVRVKLTKNLRISEVEICSI